MFLHFSHDSKFLDYFINNFSSVCEIKNKFIVTNNFENIHVKSKVKKIPSNKESVIHEINLLDNCNAIFFHYLSPFYLDILNHTNINPKIKIVWVFYGADGFFIDTIQEKLYEPITNNFLKKFPYALKFSWAWKPWNLYKEIKSYYLIKKASSNKSETYRVKFNKIDFFCNYIEQDFKLIKKHTNLKAKFIPFSFAGIDEFKEIEPISGNNILIGNSGDISNNHFDIFDSIKNIDLKGKKIYVPLSYSGNNFYIKEVIKRGKKIFGKNFIPLTTFLKFEDYKLILNSCKFLIMHQKRSQGGRNLLYSILQGKKVFLHPESNLKKKYEELGIKTFSSFEINFDNIEEKNKEIQIKNAKKFFNKQIVLERYKNLELTVLKKN